MKRPIAIGLSVLLLLSACAGAPPQPGSPSAPGEDAAEMQPAPDGPEAAKGGEESNSAAKPSPAAPASLAAQKEAQKLLRRAFELLDAGEVDKARADLDHAQELDPENKQVICLLRGMTADPATLGSEYTPYTVRGGESLGAIAARFMGDVCEFYLLARYNQIKIPKQLAAGQTIRIPGRIRLTQPPQQPQPQPVPPPAVAAPVIVPKPTPTVAEKKPPAAVEPDPRATRAEVDRRHRIAQDAYRRQDLTTAIREWDAVLALDPNHNSARVGRQQALDLQDRIDRIKKR